MYENRCGLPRQARDDPNEIERCAPCSEEERVGDCKNVIVHTLRVHHLDHLGKRHSRFEFSLCLSRACLGKMIIFIYKWLKKWRFCTIPIKPVAAGLRRSEKFQKLNIEQNSSGRVHKEAPVRTRPALGCRALSMRSRLRRGHRSSRESRQLAVRRRVFLSAFPTFVPSLSWQNDHHHIHQVERGGAFFLPDKTARSA